MKKSVKKLVLSRETLRTLDDSGLKVWGGLLPYGGNTIDDTRQISICRGCTGPLDHCPDQTQTIG